MEPQEQQSTEPTGPTTWWTKFGCYLRCLWKGLATAVAVVLLLVAVYAAFRFIPEETADQETMEDHFKYGSTRGDLLLGFPYWIWQATPLVCADTLNALAGGRLAPDYLQRVRAYASGDDDATTAKRRELSREGYKALGFLYEQEADGTERDLPVGTSQRYSFGLDRVFLNCSVCHTSTVRKSPLDKQPTLVLGMPANLFNLSDFEQFVFQCAKSGRFTQLELIPEIDALGGDLGWIDRYVVYPTAVWLLQDAIQFLEDLVGFSARQPPWGPGRNDTFTNNKTLLYGYRWREIIPDWRTTGQVNPEDVGTVDFPSIWLQGKRKTRSDGAPMQLHWDGNNDMVEERNLNAALATGALPPVIDHESLECIEQWLENLEPPKYPFPIDDTLARKGAPVYAEYCAECHGRNGRDFEGKKVGFVTPIEEIGTDRYRLDNHTVTLALNQATSYAGEARRQRSHTCPGGAEYQPPNRQVEAQNQRSGYGRIADMELEENTYRYKHFRKTNGYANMPLDGVWLRAPYLHNGSVPSLRDLLEPTDKRPRIFYRGNDVYDPEDVGFVYTAEADAIGKKFFEFDTSIPGNGNQGHEGYKFGTELPQAEKEALLEYLKTF